MIKEEPWQGRNVGIVRAWVFIAAFISSLQYHTPNSRNDLFSCLIICIASFGVLETESDRKFQDLSNARKFPDLS